MDPLTAVSLAATIVQFVDFGSKIVSKGYRLYKSSRALDEHGKLEYVTRDLQSLTKRLEVANASQFVAATAEEKALTDLSKRCVQLGDELLWRLNELKVSKDAKHRVWKSFRQALKIVWSKEELDEMAATLSAYRDQLEFHLLLSMRDSNKLSAIENSEHFHELDRRTKEIVQLLKDKESPFLEVSKREQRVQLFSDAVLNSLSFASMTDRYDAIVDARARFSLPLTRCPHLAHAKTYDWILQDNEVSEQQSKFSSWLAGGDGIFWISGKAGSGKSTLMRYIYEDSRTRTLLQKWATSSKKFITAGFFFWKSGVSEQASQLGLLRSLLYTLLEERQSEIITTFPELWDKYDKRVLAYPWDSVHIHQETYQWTVRHVRKGLENLFRADIGHVCLFIDGLDEYNGDPMDTIQLFQSIAFGKVKICLSSRPWVEFEESFSEFPKLTLQDLTWNDIQTYVNEEFAGDRRMLTLSNDSPIAACHFVTEIVTKANGVFLWVKLVVRSLLNGLTNGDTIPELQQRLKELPADLGDLYALMFAGIKPRYWSEGCKIFQMVKTSLELPHLPAAPHESKPPSSLAMSFTLEEDSQIKSEANGQILQAEVQRRIDRVDKRLRVSCAGLLELSARREHGKPSTAALLYDDEDRKLQYVHRTAKDFLSQPENWGRIVATTSETDFNVYTSLMRGHIALLKRWPQRFENDLLDLDRLLNVPFTLAYFAQKERHPPPLEVYDNLEASFTSVHRQRHQYRSQFKDLGAPKTIDFLAMAVRFHLFDYLFSKLKSTQYLALSPSGHSYLHHAVWKDGCKSPIVHDEAIVAFILPYTSIRDMEQEWLSIYFQIRTAIESLNSGGDEQFRDESLMWLSILRLFFEYDIHTSPLMKPDMVKKLVSGLEKIFPQDIKQIKDLIKRPKGLFSWLSTSKPAQTRVPRPWNPNDYPGRTWWLEPQFVADD